MVWGGERFQKASPPRIIGYISSRQSQRMDYAALPSHDGKRFAREIYYFFHDFHRIKLNKEELQIKIL